MDFPEALRSQIDALAAPVGFRFAKLESLEDIHPPTDAVLWCSPFAVMVAVSVSHSDAKQLRVRVKQASEWMLRVLRSEEKRGAFFDGYLILCLREAPSGPLRQIVQEIVVSPHICRKHTVWPLKPGDWTEHLWSITVLGLPPSEAMVRKAIAPPPIPPHAEYALKLYESLGSYEAAAKGLESKAADHLQGGTPAS
jgi:hypothetical protein